MSDVFTKCGKKGKMSSFCYPFGDAKKKKKNVMEENRTPFLASPSAIRPNILGCFFEYKNSFILLANKT